VCSLVISSPPDMITSSLFYTSIIDFDPIYVSIGDTTYYSSVLTRSMLISSLLICPNPIKNWGDVVSNT
jgi:hypothetical protein